MKMKFTCALVVLLTIYTQSCGQKSLDIYIGQNHKPFSPMMWGLFFEDINFAADGGLYAEMIMNRSFEFEPALKAWTVSDSSRVSVRNLESRKLNNLKGLIIMPGQGAVSLINNGFRGLGFRKGESYEFSLLVHTSGLPSEVNISLLDNDGQATAVALMRINTAAFERKSITFVAPVDISRGRLRLDISGEGMIQADDISLFPTDNILGLRRDLTEALKALNPSFFRFPGGCIVEGMGYNTHYKWKPTLLPVWDRPVELNHFWNRLPSKTPMGENDYYQTFGLGYMEYFLLSEYLGATPVPIVNAGIHHKDPLIKYLYPKVDSFVQDALDLIEFANGDTTTPWGKIRSSLGHPAPFNLRYIGVGNENFGKQYKKNLRIFTKAIKEKYPDIKIINSMYHLRHSFSYLSPLSFLKKRKGQELQWNEIIDEHFYAKPKWFFNNADFYDKWPAENSKIFVGEYAAKYLMNQFTHPDNFNDFEKALSEAAFMTGMERNSDKVVMAAYAPLFGNKYSYQWSPNLIWFDHTSLLKTPSYYVQQLFANHAGQISMSTTDVKKRELKGQNGIYSSTTFDSLTSTSHTKIINRNLSPVSIKLHYPVNMNIHSSGMLVMANQPDDENTFENPEQVKVSSGKTSVSGHVVSLELPPYSFVLISTIFK